MLKATRLTAAVCALTLCTSHCRADEQSLRKAAEELLVVIKGDVSLTELIMQQMGAGGGSDEVIRATREFYSKHVTWDAVEPELAAVFVERFTEAEIRDLTTFFAAPAGQKLVAAQPALNTAVVETVMDRTLKHMDEYRRMMAKAAGRVPPSQPQPEQHVEDETSAEAMAAAPLDAVFGISFDENDVPETCRTDDVKTAIIGTVIQRLKALGVAGVDIISVEASSVSIRISTMSAFNADDIADLLRRSGELTFRFVSPDNDRWAADSQRDPGGFRVPEGYERRNMPTTRDGKVVDEVVFVKSHDEELSGQDVDRAVVKEDEFGRWPISLTFTAKGARAFHKMTADNVGARLAIIADGRILSAPVIRAAISGGRAQISGSFGLKEAMRLSVAIDSGRYPVPVKVTRDQ